MTESSETKTPKPGEWWRDYDNERLYVVGTTPSGEVVCVDSKNTTYVFDEVDNYDHWHHEPRCTGFDWVEPPAETVRTEDDTFLSVRCRRKDLPVAVPVYNPETFTSDWGPFPDAVSKPRYQSDVTCSIAASERERKEIADKTIDRVKRFDPSGVPVPHYVTACETCGIGHHLPSGKCDHCNGEMIRKAEGCINQHVRCKRKDLPVPVPAVKRVRLDIIASDDGRAIWREHGAVLWPSGRFIKHDEAGFYVETPE